MSQGPARPKKTTGIYTYIIEKRKRGIDSSFNTCVKKGILAIGRGQSEGSLVSRSSFEGS